MTAPATFLQHYKKNFNAWMFFGMVAGGLLGYVAPEQMQAISIIGTFFIRLLMMLIVPVIVVSMLSGILSLGNAEKLGRIGVRTLVYYFATTVFAVATGLMVVNIVDPGKGDTTLSGAAPVHSPAVESADTSSFRRVLENFIPTNVVSAAVEGNVLGLIFFSVFLGIALLQVKQPGVTYLRESASALFSAIIWMVDQVMLVAPIGVLSLVGSLVADFTLDDRLTALGSSISWYCLSVVTGLFIHGVLTLPAVALIWRISPLRMARAMIPAVTMAFSSASSVATLPVTIDRLKREVKVSDRTASFVAPIGATINMDGTAIYEAVAAIFIANMYGVELNFSQQFVIFVTATISAVGAAGIPGAGLIMMSLVLNSVGLPVEGIQLIVVVDRALDMLRTAVNVWGDSIGAAVIGKAEGEELFKF